MSATFAMNKLNVEAYGERVTVPDNNIAKLMYYLDCVLTAIEYDRSSILTDYKNYYLLTAEERKTVIELADLFKPEIFIKAGIFIVDPNLLIDDLSNKFYKITDETIGVHANEQVIVGGKTVKVRNVMVCDSSWINRVYINPLNAIKREMAPGQSYSAVVTETSMISSNHPIAIIVNQPIKFRDRPVDIICRFCNRPIRTVTKDEFNCLACCCCLIFGILYICMQACTDKNICCCNVIHKCPKCGMVLGEYRSC